MKLSAFLLSASAWSLASATKLSEVDSSEVECHIPTGDYIATCTKIQEVEEPTVVEMTCRWSDVKLVNCKLRFSEDKYIKPRFSTEAQTVVGVALGAIAIAGIVTTTVGLNCPGVYVTYD